MPKPTIHALATPDPDKPVATIVNVTPEVAERWLGHNTVNRSIRPHNVERFARDMAAGRWQMTGEAIKFDTAGNVLDGQHRLRAVLQSGATIPMLVVSNLAPSTQAVMDAGSKRSAADALHLNGVANRTIVASAARLALAYERGDIRSAAQTALLAYSNAEIIEYVRQNPDLCDAAASYHASYAALRINPTAITFTLYLLRRIDREAADQFFDDLANLRTDGAGDPRSTLLRRLQNAQQRNERLSTVSQAHFIIRAWNALRKGQKLSGLKTGNAHGHFDFARPAA